MVPPRERTLFVSGGHEFSRRLGNEALRDYMLALTGKASPRVCLLPTASGDPADQISDFRRSLAERVCEVSEVTLFRLEDSAHDLRDRLLSQDLIYAGGGSMLNLLAIWTAHRIDRIMVEAWERGVVICGQSAGAMCWFEHGISRSHGRAERVKGMGVLPGSLCVHYHGDPERRAAFLSGVGRTLPSGYGLDDQAGLLFRGSEREEAVASRDGAGVWKVAPDGEGGATEVQLPVRRLFDPRPAIDEPAADVAEMRQVRALRGRHGSMF